LHSYLLKQTTVHYIEFTQLPVAIAFKSFCNRQVCIVALFFSKSRISVKSDW
jgi:hypothetical protein